MQIKFGLCFRFDGCFKKSFQEGNTLEKKNCKGNGNFSSLCSDEIQFLGVFAAFYHSFSLHSF